MLKQNRQHKKSKNIAVWLLIVSVAGTVGISGCGGNAGDDMPATKEAGETTTGSVADMTIEDYEAMLSNEEAVFAGAYEVNQIPEIELSDPALLPTEEEILWEGYNEEELGLLEPYEMPYCEVGINGCSYVWYNDEQYFYVNEINQKFGEGSPFNEYSNVWVTLDPENILVLGGWEEYGRTGNLAGGKGE